MLAVTGVLPEAQTKVKDKLQENEAIGKCVCDALVKGMHSMESAIVDLRDAVVSRMDMFENLIGDMRSNVATADSVQSLEKNVLTKIDTIPTNVCESTSSEVIKNMKDELAFLEDKLAKSFSSEEIGKMKVDLEELEKNVVRSTKEEVQYLGKTFEANSNAMESPNVTKLEKQILDLRSIAAKEMSLNTISAKVKASLETAYDIQNNTKYLSDRNSASKSLSDDVVEVKTNIGKMEVGLSDLKSDLMNKMEIGLSEIKSAIVSNSKGKEAKGFESQRENRSKETQKRKKGVIFSSSIGKHSDLEKLSKSLKCDFKLVETYYIERNDSAKNPEANLREQIPLNINDETEVIILQVGSNEISDLDLCCPPTTLQSKVHTNSLNVLKLATEIINISGGEIFISEQPPRYDPFGSDPK